MTRTQLAAQVGVTEKTVMRWETGATRLPEDHWAVLCSLFAVSIAHLLGIDDDGSGDDGMRRAA